MIKAVAITLLVAFAGSSISEFSLSPGESFTLHFEHDYVFSLSECGPGCDSLRISQMVEGVTTWTGQLFDLEEGKSYPFGMEFEDVVFDSVYVVSGGGNMVLRVSYRDPSPAVSHERVVKAASVKEPVEKVSFVIIGELGAVILLVFFVIHRMLHRKQTSNPEEGPQVPQDIPRPVMGFHDSWHPGIPRQEEDPDLKLLEQLRELERVKEMEMHRRMKRRADEEETLGLDWI
jgi:hypothetical protein